METDWSEKKFVVGTRASDLAKVQTYEVIDLLVKAANEKGINLTKDNFEIYEVTNSVGDTDQIQKLYNMGGTGVFCKQLEIAILENHCQIGVHSMKDLPTTPTPGLIVPAIPHLKPRDDVVILKEKHKHLGSLSNLPKGSKIGTSSLRRICTLSQTHPDLETIDIRGNLNTRLKKLDEQDFDAIVLAKAGVVRLGWEDKIDEVLDKSLFQYPPAQGALAVQWREGDEEVVELVKLIDDAVARRIVEAERVYLNTLEGGWTLPISVNSVVFRKDDGDKKEITDFIGIDVEELDLKLEGRVFDRNDFSNFLTHSVEGPLSNWTELGRELANELRKKGAEDFVIKSE